MFTTIQKEENMLQLFVLWKKLLQGACADVFTRPTLLWCHANGRNIVALLFAGHRTTEMLGPVRSKVWPVPNFTQQVPTSANIVVVPCKRTQQVTTLLVPTIVQALYWINLELIATKGFFADFTPTGTLGHHIKNVSKSIFGKLLKIVVLKHRVFVPVWKRGLEQALNV